MSEFFGVDNSEIAAIEEKEVLMSKIFDEISNQNLGEEDSKIEVRENHYSSTPEATKTIAMQRLVNDDELQQRVFTTLKIQERPKDGEDRYFILKGDNDEFKRISMKVYAEDGRMHYGEGQSETLVPTEGDIVNFNNIAKDIKNTLGIIVKRLEK